MENQTPEPKSPFRELIEEVSRYGKFLDTRLKNSLSFSCLQIPKDQEEQKKFILAIQQRETTEPTQAYAAIRLQQILEKLCSIREPDACPGDYLLVMRPLDARDLVFFGPTVLEQAFGRRYAQDIIDTFKTTGKIPAMLFGIETLLEELKGTRLEVVKKNA